MNHFPEWVQVVGVIGGFMFVSSFVVAIICAGLIAMASLSEDRQEKKLDKKFAKKVEELRRDFN